MKLTDKISVDLAEPCIVVGGKNGAGKTRFLRGLQSHLGDSSLMIDLHYLCEQALMILRSRIDFDDMTEEFTPLNLDEERLSDIARIVGREYEMVEWFSFEVEPDDDTVASRFRWSSDQPSVPYFRVRYRGVEYTSRDMGLGEFSVHFLFWILEQYRDVKEITLLLDEPDAFLPPIGVSRLLARVLRICLTRRWRVIISTHSEEMIHQARAENGFLLLRSDAAGESVSVFLSDDPSAADSLLSRPPIRHVFFCEDESAWFLTRAILEAGSNYLARASTVVWGSGEGYMQSLRSCLPKSPRPDIYFAFVFDGDQRGKVEASKPSEWPTMFLPGDSDPDTLMKSLDVTDLAEALSVDTARLEVFLDSIEGADVHDWINKLGDEYGRQFVLRTLSVSWCEKNPESVAEFLAQLRR
ncbi:AAA family ATPase [Mycobacterium sp. LTG2003]